MGKNYNTWGGKNNSWGNKNRKGGGKGPQRDDETWSKGAKVALAGVFLFTLAHTGLGPIVETATNVMDVFDLGNDIKEQKLAKSNKSNKGKKDSESLGYSTIKNNIDLEAADVKDILEFLHNELVTSDSSSMATNETTAIFIEYDSFKNSTKYNKNIMNKLEKYEGAVSFIAVHPDYLSEAEMQEEFERVADIIQSNNEGNNSVFTKIKTNALTNVPRSGSFVMTVTFTE